MFSLSVGGLPEPEVVQQLADSAWQEDFDELGEQISTYTQKIFGPKFWVPEHKVLGSVERPYYK